jgi:hypothetical protein
VVHATFIGGQLPAGWAADKRDRRGGAFAVDRAMAAASLGATPAAL